MKIFLIMAGLLSTVLLLAQQYQEPDAIRRKVGDIENRFMEVLAQECSGKQCQPVGCLAINFETLDTKPNSELPGLEDRATSKNIQYRLRSASCEFTHEPSVTKEHVYAIVQRVKQKIRFPGVRISLKPRQLFEKPDRKEINPEEKSVETIILEEFLPFLPWMVSGALFVIATLLLIWTWRRPPAPKPVHREEDANGRVDASTPSSPHSAMIVRRIDQLKNRIDDQEDATIAALRVYLEQQDLNDLCLYLDHFGSELFTPYLGDKRFEEILTELSK